LIGNGKKIQSKKTKKRKLQKDYNKDLIMKMLLTFIIVVMKIAQE